MNRPMMALVRQTFDRTCVVDVPAAVHDALERIGVLTRVKAHTKRSIPRRNGLAGEHSMDAAQTDGR